VTVFRGFEILRFSQNDRIRLLMRPGLIEIPRFSQDDIVFSQNLTNVEQNLAIPQTINSVAIGQDSPEDSTDTYGGIASEIGAQVGVVG